MEYVDVKMENPFGTVVFSVHPLFFEVTYKWQNVTTSKTLQLFTTRKPFFFGHKKDFLPQSILFENDSEIVTKCFEQLYYY